MYGFKKRAGIFWTQYLLMILTCLGMLSWVGCGSDADGSVVMVTEVDPLPDPNAPDYRSKWDAWCRRQPKLEPPVLPDYEPDLSKKDKAIEGIFLASDIPDDLYRALAKDIRSIRNLKIVDPDGWIAALLNLKGPVTGDALLGWLTQRLKFIVKGSYGMDHSVPRTESNNFAAANPGDMYMSQHDGDRRPHQVEIPGWGWIRVDSPRVGIVEMGRQLMNPEWSQNPQTASRERIAMLFHEARHSDGRQQNTAFPHVPCPKGRPDAGSKKCDPYLNGPVALQSAVLKGMILACEECTPEAKKWQLRLIDLYLENILSDEIADERPTGLLYSGFFISDEEPMIPQDLRGIKLRNR